MTEIQLPAAPTSVDPRSGDNDPLVSIGVPVRNGAEFLDDALKLLVAQSYRNLEIIVSDNGSSDASAEIIRRYAAEDSRIKVHRPPRLLTALENFQFVFERSSGGYFMWAACDDRRSTDYVEHLLRALQRAPSASLAFGAVAEIPDTRRWAGSPELSYPFECGPQMSPRKRILKYTRFNCLHVYGLIRRDKLDSYHWLNVDNGPDIPMNLHLALAGDFVRSSGGVFSYYTPQRPKTLKERARTNNHGWLRPMPELRLSWACADVVARHYRARDSFMFHATKLRALALVYSNRHWRWLKPALFKLAPPFMVTFYRSVFK